MCVTEMTLNPNSIALSHLTNAYFIFTTIQGLELFLIIHDHSFSVIPICSHSSKRKKRGAFPFLIGRAYVFSLLFQQKEY